MNEAEIRKGLIDGVALALKRARTWSNGRVWPGDTGAENLIQVSIAQKVFGAARRVPPVIELEATLGRLGVEGDRRRVDIALMRHADHYERPHPFCVIEVKKAPGGDFAEDLRKLETLLDTVPTIRYGFLATYFQHRLAAGGRSRSVETFMGDLHVAVSEAAEQHHLALSRVEARSFRGIVFDDAGDRHCAGAVIHRFARPS